MPNFLISRRLPVAAGLLFLSSILSSQPSFAAATEVRDLDGVKAYLVTTVTGMKNAAAKYEALAKMYAKIVAENGGDPAKAYITQKNIIDGLVKEMQDCYKAMDSFGYETVEGIVAGVESLAHYDVDLDAGVPKSEGPDDVAQIKLELSDGSVIDQEGALFTYIIEPALWGGDKRWVTPVDLNGNGSIEDRESLPRPEVLVASAKEADKRVGELLADSKAWKPTTADAFGAMITMTPTLPEYFEDWKESRYGDGSFSRFTAVSRVSDMKGIMQSCSILFQAVSSEVAAKDGALEKSISGGFRKIDAFLNELAEKEKAGKISGPVIEELANQAKEKTDKLVPQIEQASALVKGK